MLANQGQAAEIVAVLTPNEKADTAEATSAWIDVSKYEGDLVFVVLAGAVTAGDITFTVEDADDNSGTNNAALAPIATPTVVTTSNDPLVQKIIVPAQHTRGWVQLIGTIDTGPVEVGAVMLAHPKYV